MSDLIERQAAIDAVNELTKWYLETYHETRPTTVAVIDRLTELPSAQPEIIRCEDCKFYSPMNRETKTGICNLTMHQNFGDNWFCAGAERRTDGNGRKEGTG